MSHIKSYQLVEEASFGDFTNTVNRLLSEGWELHGPTQIIVAPYYTEHRGNEFDTYYYQAMVFLKAPMLEPQPKP